MPIKTAGKERLDNIILKLNLASSLKEAAALVMAGRVFVNGRKSLYPSERYDVGSHPPPEIKISGSSVARGGGGVTEYVSRGGLKLDGAFKSLGLDVKEKVCLDIGSSTGGFTDVLLKNGASKVYAFDVGRNLLHEKILSDKRVVSVEGFNFRYFSSVLKKSDERYRGFYRYCYEAATSADFAVCDVSFISVKKILLSLVEGLDIVRSADATSSGLAEKDGCFRILALVKPQFELHPRHLEKGVVRDAALGRAAAEEIALWARNFLKGVVVRALIPSSIKGASGNEEFFLLMDKVRYIS